MAYQGACLHHLLKSINIKYVLSRQDSGASTNYAALMQPKCSLNLLKSLEIQRNSMQTSTQVSQTSRIQLDVKELALSCPASQGQIRRSSAAVDGILGRASG
jgi:hypothetical protein